MIWFEHHMRWVLITALGWPVDPEVNRNFAMVSGPTFACAASIAAPGLVAASSENNVVLPAGKRIARHHELDIGGNDRLDRLAKRVTVGGEDKARASAA